SSKSTSKRRAQLRSAMAHIYSANRYSSHGPEATARTTAFCSRSDRRKIPSHRHLRSSTLEQWSWWPAQACRVRFHSDFTVHSCGRNKEMHRIARRISAITIVVVITLAAYLSFWPVPAEPVAWSAPTPPGYSGVYATNTKLSGLRAIDIGNEFGPEHMAIGPDGKLYAAMTSGSLVRMDPDGQHQEPFANTGGRVLGFDFDAQGRMIAADAMKGLLLIAPADGSVRVLADRL